MQVVSEERGILLIGSSDPLLYVKPLWTVSHDDGGHQLYITKADHDQRSPSEGETEGFWILDATQRAIL